MEKLNGNLSYFPLELWLEIYEAFIFSHCSAWKQIEIPHNMILWHDIKDTKKKNKASWMNKTLINSPPTFS